MLLINTNINKTYNNNKIKAIIYGKNFENKKIEFNKKKKYYENLKKNDILLIKLINKTIKVKIKEIQKHPYKKEIIHIDFLKNE